MFNVRSAAKSGIRWIMATAAAFMLVACSSTYPPAPTAGAAKDYSYKIGPGDNLSIVVWRNPELSMVVPVRPDGKISAPLVDDLTALGKDPTTLARDIEKELGKGAMGHNGGPALDDPEPAARPSRKGSNDDDDED